jgi:acyl-CoA hydrolase
MEPKTFITHHLVKGEDLNHHGTLFAGRTAEWFVESGFIAAASTTKPDNIVCLKLHGMLFTAPVKKGEIACFESKIVFTGKSKLVTYVQVKVQETTLVDGFITFIHVDENGRPKPHHLEITPATPEDVELQERAAALFSK